MSRLTSNTSEEGREEEDDIELVGLGVRAERITSMVRVLEEVEAEEEEERLVDLDNCDWKCMAVWRV